MKSCRADGKILKPDVPAIAIDAMFYEKAFGKDFGPKGEVNNASPIVSNSH